MRKREASKVKVGDKVKYPSRASRLLRGLVRTELTVKAIVLEDEDPRTKTPLFLTERGHISYLLLDR